MANLVYDLDEGTREFRLEHGDLRLLAVCPPDYNNALNEIIDLFDLSEFSSISLYTNSVGGNDEYQITPGAWYGFWKKCHFAHVRVHVDAENTREEIPPGGASCSLRDEGESRDDWVTSRTRCARLFGKEQSEWDSEGDESKSGSQLGSIVEFAAPVEMKPFIKREASCLNDQQFEGKVISSALAGGISSQNTEIKLELDNIPLPPTTLPKPHVVDDSSGTVAFQRAQDKFQVHITVPDNGRKGFRVRDSTKLQTIIRAALKTFKLDGDVTTWRLFLVPYAHDNFGNFVPQGKYLCDSTATLAEAGGAYDRCEFVLEKD